MGNLRRIKKHLLRSTMDTKTLRHRLGKMPLSKIKLTSRITRKKKKEKVKVV